MNLTITVGRGLFSIEFLSAEDDLSTTDNASLWDFIEADITGTGTTHHILGIATGGAGPGRGLKLPPLPLFWFKGDAQQTFTITAYFPNPGLGTSIAIRAKGYVWALEALKYPGGPIWPKFGAALLVPSLPF